MGEYATTTSFSELIPYALKGNTTTSDALGTAILSKHIVRAESIVNSYVGARYELPFAVVPPVIRALSEDVACYFFIRASYVQDGERKNEYADSYKLALSILEDIREGKTKLMLSDGSILTGLSTSRFKSSTIDYAPTFDLDEPTQWRTDPDRLDEIAEGRK